MLPLLVDDSARGLCRVQARRDTPEGPDEYSVPREEEITAVNVFRAEADQPNESIPYKGW